MKRLRILGVAALGVACYWLLWGETSQKDLSRMSIGGWIGFVVTTGAVVTTVIVSFGLFCSPPK
jgi:hypothetical protein